MQDMNQSKEDMIQYILNNGRLENEKIFKSKYQEIKKDYKEKIKRLNYDQTKYSENKKLLLDDTYKRKLQRIDLDKNKTIMQIKQKYLEEVIETVMEKLKNLSNSEIQMLVSPIFISNQLKGKVHVVVGQYWQGAITEDWLKELAVDNDIDIDYIVSSRNIPKDGGFILSQGGIDYNYLYSDILTQIRDEKEYEIVSILFENEVC